MSHTHTHTIDVIVDVRMTSCDVIVGIGKTSLPVYGHTVYDTRLQIFIQIAFSFEISLIRLEGKRVSRKNRLLMRSWAQLTFG